MNTKQTTITEAIIKILKAFGVPANWAKVLGGALAGAAIALYALTLSSCGMSVTAAVQGDAYRVTMEQQQPINGNDAVEVFIDAEGAK